MKGDVDELFALLAGLATVAAVTRAVDLSRDVRVLKKGASTPNWYSDGGKFSDAHRLDCVGGSSRRV